MGHRLDIAAGKNEFDRRLGNFRVQIKFDDEGEHVATITASLLAPRSLSEHLRSTVRRHPSTVDISTPAPDALRLAISILRAAKEQPEAAGRSFSPLRASSNSIAPHGWEPGREIEKGKEPQFRETPTAKSKAGGAHAIRSAAISL
jgi:hypothetical protein